ncbi:hypothetical protein [Providencia vermicola]|uniref:hypothetical protein n=1 Tax=Providencia vermicola TaxID=333965 RepID=UPI0034DD31AC
MKISRIVSHSFISTQCIGYQYAVRWCRIGEEVPWMGVGGDMIKRYHIPQTQKKPPIGWLSH